MSKRDSKHSSSAIRLQRSVEEGQLDKSNELRKLIEQHGFDTFGVVDINPNLDFKKELDEFLEKNHHGEMAWMEKRSNCRSNPNVLWDEAQSIIVLGINYHFECNSLELLSEKNKGIISVYSRNSDYHKIIKKKLKSLSDSIKTPHLIQIHNTTSCPIYPLGLRLSVAVEPIVRNHPS